MKHRPVPRGGFSEKEKSMKKLVLKLSLLLFACCAFLITDEASARESTGLPVVYINTDGGAAIASKEDYIGASLVIEDEKGTAVYDGVTEVKGHGNSTWKRFPKKSIKLKLDKSTDLFGMGKNKHWLLIANYIDPSCMRNKTSVQVAKILGADCMDCIWVDVVINGEEYGNYVLYEQARISKDRVDIYDWETAGEDAAKAIAKAAGLSDDDKSALKTQMAEGDMSWISTGTVLYKGVQYTVSDYFEYPENNGGFLFEIDNYYDEVSKFMTDRSIPVMFKKPEFINTDAGTMGVARNLVQNMENAFYSTDKTTMIGSVNTSYVELCDVDSLISFVLSNEIMFSEFGYKSNYFYKDTGDSKIVFGPIWDFDWSSDCIAPYGEISETGWYSSSRDWFSAVKQDPYFAIKARELYLNKLDELDALTSTEGTLALWKEQIRASARQNEIIWHYCRGFETDWQTLVDWLKNRTEWINSQMISDQGIVASMGTALSADVTSTITGTGLIGNTQGVDQAWYGTTGGTYSVTVSAPNAASVNLYVNGILVENKVTTAGAATFDLKAAWLTEETGTKNVLVFRTRNSEGTFTGVQFATLTLFASAPTFCTVTFEDYGSTSSVSVPVGSTLIAPESAAKGTAVLTGSWFGQAAGVTVAPNGKISVNSNITLQINIVACTNGTEHTWQHNGSAYVCTICGKEANFNSYISMTDCTFNQSTRYGSIFKAKSVHPTITVYYGGRQLTQGVEYNIEFGDDVNAGFGYYVVTGIKSAGFDGKAVLSFGIKRRAMNNTNVKVKVAGGNVYSGSAVEPEVTVTLFGITLTRGVDFEATYSNNVEVGTGTVTLTGIGQNMEGTTSATFDITYINAPQNLKASKLDWCSNQLTWDESIEAEGYVIYRAASATGKYYLLGTSLKNSFVDKEAAPGQKYYYKVAALRELDGESVFSARSKAAYVTTATAKVTGLKVRKRTCSSLALSWNAVSGATGYQIYRATSKTGTYTLVKTVKGTSANVTGLTADTIYYFKIKAYVTIDGTDYLGSFSGYSYSRVLPAAVTGLKATGKKAGVTLTWNKVSSVTGYKIYRLNQKTGEYILIATVSSSKLTYTDTTCTAGTKNTYKVRAYKTVGEKTVYGAYSSEVKGTRTKSK